MARPSSFRRTAATLATLLLAPLALSAQSAQRWSIQASALYVVPSGSAYDGLAGGLGFEAQARYTPGVLSLGAGFQTSSHTLTFDNGSSIDVTLTGGFIEPRYVIDIHKPSLAPYLSARLAILTQKGTLNGVTASSTGTQINGGGGVLIRMSRRINIDLGVTFGAIHFGDFKLENGSQSQIVQGSSGNGTNLVFRGGVAVGLGK
jgi:outer membrane protein with beta-barrel domain